MKKILFICTGNTCRSPMAQGIFEAVCKEKKLPFECKSAGLATATGLPVSENSAVVLKEQGIDISDFKATSVADLNFEDFDLIVVMTREHKDVLEFCGVSAEKIYILAESKGGISDPYGGSVGRYRICRDEIAQGIDELLELLGEENGD